MPAGELVEPMAYGWWWPLVGALLVAGVVAWFWWVLRSTRGPAAGSPPPAAAADAAAATVTARPDPYAAARDAALARLQAVEDRYAAGDLDTRGAHLELRYVVREFAAARTGVPTATVTASDARGDRRLRRLAGALEQSSRPAFAARTRAQVRTSLREARKLVRTW
ncbi:hypothetical protein GC089_02165 [Cellulomonas sp. JZ18]|uniref:hypothetical protein n=1 Tax=Cellulomonas sp. JZ18 TaxID=2654191 RepID=UPI0012D4654A|nr:hypothetical protein [Cellulomonas sp. JZ18]QGQ18285.1 hypothetical protein GC089_02165 [Cellulomonas sp. JZ18]